MESYDPNHDVKLNPPLQVLWTSYFITVHSEFEDAWNITYQGYNSFHSATEKYGKISHNYFNSKAAISYTHLDQVVNNHRILFCYNFIRNKIVHGSANISSSEYLDTKQAIDNGRIRHVKIETDGTTAKFVITGIEFITEYVKTVLNFFEDILPK